MLIGGLDIGTTGCKLSVYGEDGVFVTNAYREYAVERRNGMHEFRGDNILEAVYQVMGEVLSRHEVTAIGVTSFGESFVALDEEDQVLLPSMLYTDPRGGEECRELCERMGEERLTYITGVKPHSMYSLPKIMWIKKHLPDTYARIRRILLMEDYVVYQLCGRAVIDHALAARTMALDIRSRRWSREIFEAAGVDVSLMSEPVSAGYVAGELKRELAERFGVTYPLRIVNGSHDQVAATVGAGILQPGEAMDGTGTVECVVPVFDHIPSSPGLYREGYSVVPYVLEGTYVCYALSFAGGATLRWFRDNFAKHYAGQGNAYALLDGEMPENPTGILVLPHFAGAANPYMDNESRGAMVGLTLEHTGADVYKALMEGVTYENMVNIEHLESFGVRPQRLYATGGGATSEAWMQIKADILNRPVTSLEAKEVGACGTCMLVGVGIGLYRDLWEAKGCFVRERRTCYPQRERAELYERYYQAYRGLYDAVRPIIKEMQG